MTERPTPHKFAGADWMKSLKIEMSPLGECVADILGQAFRGIYHISGAVLHKRVKWNDTRGIEVVVRSELATYDFSELTELVILCHDACVRLEIIGASNRYLRLVFSARNRSGNACSSHPTIGQSIDRIRSNLVSVTPWIERAGANHD